MFFSSFGNRRFNSQLRFLFRRQGGEIGFPTWTKIDVMLLCGGSATDLPEQGPYLAKMFNTVDSYFVINHNDISRNFAR